jgi:GTP pyrophosphokinase
MDNVYSYKTWLSSLATRYDASDIQLFEKTIAIANKLNETSEQKSEHIKFGVSIAEKLEELDCDAPTLAAAILYPTYRARPKIKEQLDEALGKSLTGLITGTLRMEAVDSIHINLHSGGQQKKRLDNLRKMLLTIVDDIRIILIKLAERICTLHRLKNTAESIKKPASQQIIALYAPLANRLGIGQFKWELEDLAFRYLDPKNYADISRALNMRRKDREHFVIQFTEELRNLLKGANIKNADISGRAKHIYSIYRKIERKKVDFSQIYDAIATRVLVPKLEDCYTTLSLAHEKWKHIPEEFDDYIAKPKLNGYQSIHTAVVGANNINVEIQIRTFQMHQEAELGVAAHWKYKEGNSKQSSYEEKISVLREMMNWQKEVSSNEKNNDLYQNLFEDRVYVFTPQGDILDMQAGSTPLDYAYLIHTQVGHRCKGAKVNGHISTLKTPLETGDQVEILTAKEGQPSRDWLNPEYGYLITSNARNKVKHWFTKETHDENILRGHALWEKGTRQKNIPKNSLNELTQLYHFRNSDDLFAAVGKGDIGITTALNRLHLDGEPLEAHNKEKTLESNTPPTWRAPMTVKSIGNLLTQLARCCQPIPGDTIVGYITKNRGITIHQQKCHNLHKVLQLNPERIIEVSWEDNKPTQYPVDLVMEANDRNGLIRDVSSYISNNKIKLLAMNTQTNSKHHSAQIHLTLEIDDTHTLNKIIGQLQQLPDITAVRRKE